MSDDFEPVRLGIAGTGFISGVHAACAIRSPFVELVAVASARGRATRERVGALAPTVELLTLEELFARDDVEAIMVCTRTSDHAEHAVQVLEGSKHLLLEKPGATTVATSPESQRPLRAHPELVTRVAYHRHHDARFREVADRLAAGEIGEPFAVHLTSREDFPPSDADAAAGGFIMDVGVHDFDTARWLLGRDPTAVLHPCARAGLPRYRRRQRLHHDRARRARPRPWTSRGHRCTAWTSAARWSGPAGRSRSPSRRSAARTAVLTAESASAFPADCRGRFHDAYRRRSTPSGRACRGRDRQAPPSRTIAGPSPPPWPPARAAPAANGSRSGPSWDWNPARSG